MGSVPLPVSRYDRPINCFVWRPNRSTCRARLIAHRWPMGLIYLYPARSWTSNGKWSSRRSPRLERRQQTAVVFWVCVSLVHFAMITSRFGMRQRPHATFISQCKLAYTVNFFAQNLTNWKYRSVTKLNTSEEGAISAIPVFLPWRHIHMSLPR